MSLLLQILVSFFLLSFAQSQELLLAVIRLRPIFLANGKAYFCSSGKVQRPIRTANAPNPAAPDPNCRAGRP